MSATRGSPPAKRGKRKPRKTSTRTPAKDSPRPFQPFALTRDALNIESFRERVQEIARELLDEHAASPAPPRRNLGHRRASLREHMLFWVRWYAEAEQALDTLELELDPEQIVAECGKSFDNSRAITTLLMESGESSTGNG